MEKFCGSQFWDWNLTWYTENPDFTPCFERTVISNIPCLFLLIFSLVDIYLSYHSKSRGIPWSPLNSGKVIVTFILVLLEVMKVIVTRVIFPAWMPWYQAYPVDLYVPVIRAVTLILAFSLILYSKDKGVRSSGVQFIFWLLFSITQAIRFRTVILLSQQDIARTVDPMIFTIEIMYLPLVLGQLILHCWADMAPDYNGNFDVTSTNESTTPELACSFLSKIIFEWFTPLSLKGYRKPLEYPDLWQLDSTITSPSIVPTFDRYWPKNLNVGRKVNVTSTTNDPKGDKYTTSQNYEASRNTTGNRPGIFVTSSKAFGLQYLCGFCLRIVPDLMAFVSPLILNLLINFVESDEPQWKGILYACLLLLNPILGTIFGANGIHIFYRTGIRMRTALVSAVYRKTLLLSNSAKRNKSAGEIVNHMAVDAQYIGEVTQSGNILLTAPLIIGIALYFLWSFLGPSALAGVVIMVLLVPLNGYVASKIQNLQKEQMQYKDQRTKLMNEILNGMKCLKLYAWEPSFEKQVMKIRQEELRVLKLTAYLNSVSNFLWTCAPFLVAVGTFGTYILIDSSNVLDAQTAFVSLSLFNVMNQPLTYMPILISNYVQASVGLKRLNDYLNEDEIDFHAVSHDPNEAHPVIIDNCSFSWDSSNGTGNTLKDINFTVKDGELVAIVGPVGSGKSSLLSALLNELVKTKGERVNIRGTIAYVAQQAWIQNATVRDNILFGKRYDPIKYKKVIEACALKPDLDMLPAGDKTEIGEKGINLSGGQKQRVSLARAVYSNADVFLFDDPLSAVDAHVGKHIFDKVIGPKGLLRKKTRLLVTHGVVYLPFMHNIVVMTNGQISETGSYEQLQNKNGSFADFLKHHVISDSSGESEGKSAKKRRKRNKSSTTGHTTDSDTESVMTKRVQSNASFISSVNLENKLIEVETAETEGVKASVYLDYLRAAGWTLVGATLVMHLIFQGFSVGANLWLSEWTNAPFINGTDTQVITNRNHFYLGIYGGLGFLQAITILIATLVMALGTVKSANVLHFNMLKRILRAPLQFFDVTPIGRILNRFSRDVDTLDNIIPLYLRFLINGIFSVLAILVVISVSTPIFMVVILPVGLLYYFIQRFYVATSRQLKRLESITKSPIYSHFGETISGAVTIRAYGQQDRFILESEKRQDYNMMSFYSSMASNRWVQIRLESIGNLVVFFAALFAVLGKDTLNAGLVGLSVSYALQVTAALYMLVRFTSDVEMNIVAVERMKEYSQCGQEAPWEVPLYKPGKGWPGAGQIEFDGYKARYREGLDLVLRNVTCKIKAGEKVGIVGRTGAGKSSVTLGIFRIVEAAGGRILVDGEDISRFGLHDVRGRISIIPQEPMLFSGSLRMNLDPVEGKGDRELWRVLELAHLKEFVEGLSGGLDYEIAEGGENLSVGQRQLVCLARALLRKTQILVLDEATSAVDLDTEDLILKTIKEEFKDSTVITIAHRLNTIMDSDRVIVLEKGEIIEFDTPQNLLQDSTSIFHGMAKEAGVTVSKNNFGADKKKEDGSLSNHSNSNEGEVPKMSYKDATVHG